MKKAYKVYEDGSRKAVYAKNCDTINRKKTQYECIECGATATLRISKNNNNYFGATHVDGCSQASKKSKSVVTKRLNLTTVESIQNLITKEKAEKKGKDKANGGKGKKTSSSKTEEDNNPALKEVKGMFRTVKDYYGALAGLDPISDNFLGKPVCETIVSADTIDRYRTRGLKGLQLIILKPCNPDKLTPPITVKKPYICLRDGFSSPKNSTIYAMVRIEDDTTRDVWWDILKSWKESPKKAIAILGEWKKYDKDGRKVYEVSITNKDMIAVVNVKS